MSQFLFHFQFNSYLNLQMMIKSLQTLYSLLIRIHLHLIRLSFFIITFIISRIYNFEFILLFQGIFRQFFKVLDHHIYLSSLQLLHNNFRPIKYFKESIIIFESHYHDFHQQFSLLLGIQKFPHHLIQNLDLTYYYHKLVLDVAKRIELKLVLY